MARGRRPTAPAPPAGSPRETARLSCPGCPGRWGAAKPRHIIAATNAYVRKRATGSSRVRELAERRSMVIRLAKLMPGVPLHLLN